MTPEYIVDRSKVDRKTGCWIWVLTLNEHGYGVASKNTKNTRAHRLSWELSNGPIPKGAFVCHKCDNRACVNPDHLFLTDAAGNSADMVRKGRSKTGENHWCSKLSQGDVRAIRESAKSYRTLAKEYGVSHGNIGFIKTNKTWAIVDSKVLQ